MKRFFLVIATVMGMAITAEAQKMAFGPKVGINFTSLQAFGGDKAHLREEFNEVYDYTSGAQIGVVANISIASRFSIQPEILYSQRGYESHTSLDENDPSQAISTKLRMNYLEVPLLAKLSFGGEKLRGFMTIGPSVGYWMNGKSVTTYGGQEEKKDYEFQDDYSFGLKENRFDMGANMGIGMAYYFGSSALNMEIRYGLGLSDIANYEGGRPEGNPKVGNRSFGVSLAYLYGGR